MKPSMESSSTSTTVHNSPVPLFLRRSPALTHHLPTHLKILDGGTIIPQTTETGESPAKVVEASFGGGEQLQHQNGSHVLKFLGNSVDLEWKYHHITHPHAITFKRKMRLEMIFTSPVGVRMWSSVTFLGGGIWFTPRIIPDCILPDTSIHFIQFPGMSSGILENVSCGFHPPRRISLLSSIFTPGDEITVGDPTHTLGEEDSKPIVGPEILNLQDDSNGTGWNLETGISPVAKFPAWEDGINLGVIYYQITGNHGNILNHSGGGLHFIQFP